VGRTGRHAIGVAVAALIPLVAGCGTGEREDAVRSVTERFHAALDSRDGGAACAELSDQAASTLEQQEDDPCERAILSLELPAGARVAGAEVYTTSAVTHLAEGGATFLSQGSDGWKVSAAGCETALPDQPYECELED
jgi:hypothetical protein